MRLEEKEEQDLVNRLIAKENTAWKELFLTYSQNLTAVCSRYIVEEHHVRDILQNSFIKMFHSIASFQYRGKGALRAWITRIVINESLKHLKQNQQQVEVTLDPATFPDLVDEDEKTELDEIPKKVLFNMIKSLPEGYRTVLNLYAFEQKSHREIALLLGITGNTSASQLHRARILLSQKIKDYKKSKSV